MRLRNMATAGAALGLILTPIMAQAANSPVRAASPVDEAEGMGGGSGIIIAVLALAAVAAGVVVATEDEDEPTSP